jgi:hypothetical protein
VKVCSLYGAGFYYIPGTDICLKVGAYFRAEYAVGNMAGSLTNLDAIGADGQRTRLTGPDYQQRARAFIFLDSRQQTAYGTLRAYMNVGWTSDLPGSGTTSAAALYANRAFIQLAGFTWGVATSYYDFFSSPATSYTVPFSSDTGDGGWKVAAYTAQLGNGLSATLSLEEPRRQTVVNTTMITGGGGQFQANSALTENRVNAVLPVGGLPLSNEEKVKWPDIVANLRVDQAWGAAQIMGAISNTGGGYYGNSLVNTQQNGHPGDEIGFAVGAGIKVNFPMIGPGDYLQAQVNYTEGATRYAALTPSGTGAPGIFGNGNGVFGGLGVGWFTDAVYCGATNVAGSVGCAAGPTGLQLTTAWSVQAAYEHYWTPSLRTSLVGAYTDVSYNATASNALCSTLTPAIAANGTAAAAAQNAQASNTIAGGTLAGVCGAGSWDWSYWSVSSRTQWNITKDFYVGLEGFYGHLNTMSKGQTVVYRTNAAQQSATKILDDQDVFVYRVRVHRDLVP